MSHIIEDLWNGDIMPRKWCEEDDPELSHLITLIEWNRTELCNGITEKQQEIFDKYIDCLDEYYSRLTKHAFCEGFCLAAKMIAESLT